MSSEKLGKRVRVEHRGEVTAIRIRPRRDGWTLLATALMTAFLVAWAVGLWQCIWPSEPPVRGLSTPGERTLFAVMWSLGGLIPLLGLARLHLATELIGARPGAMAIRPAPWHQTIMLPWDKIGKVRLHAGHPDSRWLTRSGRISVEYEGREVYFGRGLDAGEARELLELISDRVGGDALLPEPQARDLGPQPPAIPFSGAEAAQGRVKVRDEGGALVIRLPVHRGAGWYAAVIAGAVAATAVVTVWSAAGCFALLRGTQAVSFLIDLAGFVSFLSFVLVAAVLGWTVGLIRGELIRITREQIAVRKPSAEIRTLGFTHQYAAAEIRHLRLMPLAPFGWVGPDEDGWIAFEYAGETERFCYHVEESEARFVFDTIAARFGDSYHFAKELD